MTPSPEQIQAAMPAMREWCARNRKGALTVERDPSRAPECIEIFYPGGVAQFIKDQEEKRG